MTTPSCTPINAPAEISDLELRPDPLVDLLECLADLVVETAQQRRAIEPLVVSASAEARDAIRRLAALEQSLKQVGLEAATVHQSLQHEHLI